LLNCSKYWSHTPSKCRASLSNLTRIDRRCSSCVL
jgi:hypothetical protein